MKGQPRRDWTFARAKVEREGRCRWHREKGCDGPLQAVHIIKRDRDRFQLNGEPWWVSTWEVVPVRIIPGCRRHHEMYDAHNLDALPVLEIEEQLQAVRDAGGVELMRRRTAPLAYKERRAA